MQNYEKEDVKIVIRNLKRLSECQAVEKVRTLSGAGNYKPSEP